MIILIWFNKKLKKKSIWNKLLILMDSLILNRMKNLNPLHQVILCRDIIRMLIKLLPLRNYRDIKVPLKLKINLCSKLLRWNIKKKSLKLLFAKSRMTVLLKVIFFSFFFIIYFYLRAIFKLFLFIFINFKILFNNLLLI